MKGWQVQFWEPSVAFMDASGFLSYYTANGKAKHAALAGGFRLAPHDGEEIQILFTSLTDKFVFFVVKTNKQVKNESMPSYYKISRVDFNYWLNGDIGNLVEVVQEATENEWCEALKFVFSVAATVEKKKKAEAFFG